LGIKVYVEGLKFGIENLRIVSYNGAEFRLYYPLKKYNPLAV